MKTELTTDLKDFTNFIFGSMRNLNQITRFPTRQRSYDEKVATHIYWVSIYSLVLADILNNQGVIVNTEILLRKALVHDIEETISGDVARTAKKEYPEMFQKLAEISMDIALKDLPDYLRKCYFINTLENDSLETKILKIADELSGIVYSAEQLKMGNQNFHNILEGYIQNLSKITKDTPLIDLYTIITTMIRNYHLYDYDTYSKK